MNCECNNNSNRVEPRIKHVYGNVLRMAIPLTLRTLVKDGDEMIVNDTDFIPSSDHLVRVAFSKGKTNYPIIATMDGNVAIIEDKGKIPVGTYDISVECYDDLGNPYRFKQNAVLYVTDTTAEAGIDEEIEYEAQTWYLNAAVFLATTEIGEIGDVIDAKLDDVFGNVMYDANAKEIRFYNKGNSRVLATLDSRPFVVDGTVADVYIDVSRQVLVVVLNEDAGGRRFSVPLYLVFNSYYKKDEVDSLVSRTVEGVMFDFLQELPLVVPVTKNGSSISSSIDYGAIENAIREDGRLVVACVNNAKFYQLSVVNGMEVVFSRVTALDGYQELLIVNESNVWSMEDVDLGTGGGGGGYEPPVGGIPKTDLASDVQTSLGKADTALQSFTETDPTVPSWAKADTKPTYTAQEVGALPASTTIPTKTSDLTNDSGFTSNAGTITGITMNGTSKGTSGVVDLGTVITAHQDISGKANTSDLADVATSGDYDDLSNKPTIPDTSGFATTAAMNTALAGKQDTLTFDTTPTANSTNPVTSGGIKTYVDGKATITGITTSQDGTFTISLSDGNSYTVNLNHVHPQYLTEHQSLSGYAKFVLCQDEAEYNAIATKDSGTLYLIPES